MGSTGATKGTAKMPPKEEPPKITGLDFTKMTDSEQDAQIKALQNEMGQTGDEAGKYNLPKGSNQKMYVNCSKSFDINYFLATGKVGSPQSTWTTSAGYDKYDIQNDISKMDNGMKPLSQAVMGYKYADGATLGRMLGMDTINNSNIQSLMNTLQSDSVAKQDFITRLKETDYTHPGYTSITYLPEHSTYDNSPVRLDFVMRQGSNAIVTNNKPEHEIIGARGAKYNLTGEFSVEENYSKAAGKKIKQLVIKCYI